jgi:hypothetical protein
MRLTDIAPRLALARDQFVARRAYAQSELLNLERLVAHRDLQLARSYGSRNGRYIATRQRKLAQAQRTLERFRRDAA